MIDAIRASFKKGLPDLDWMDGNTRRAAEDKVLSNSTREYEQLCHFMIIIIISI